MDRARGLRAALAAAVVAPLLGHLGGAAAVSVAVTCPGSARAGSWQVLPVEAFRGVEGVRTRDVVQSHAVDVNRPERVLVTNGTTVKRSTSYGCAWEDVLVLDTSPDEAVPVSGATSSVVATALVPRGAALAAVREGSGAASRPHVLRSPDGRRDSWRAADAGLPPQGAPRLLVPASDGRTVYLVLAPLSGGGGDDGALPALPDVTGEPSGLLYASTDAGASWVLRTEAGQLAGGGVDVLAVDPRDPDLLYAVSGGRLLVSRDGGRTLTDAGVAGVRSVVALEAGELAVATEDGPLLHSRDGGRTFTPRANVRGVDGMAYRAGDDALVVDAGGVLVRVDARGDGRTLRAPARAPALPGSVRGDRSRDASFTAVSGHDLLRWVDPPPPGTPPPPPPVTDVTAPPPPPGRVAPPTRAVELPVGTSRLVDFTLVLPPSPTPLDLVFLVDTSPSMKDYIRALRPTLQRLSGALAADGVDLRVGLATAGPGPGTGEPPYPEVDPTRRDYRKPALYRLLRPVGPVDAQLAQALAGVQEDSAPQNDQRPEVREGQLVALRELVLGLGVEEEASTALAPRYAVAPGQQVRFRQQEGVRKLVLHATDEGFNNPHGTPRRPDGTPDLEGVAAVLRSAGVVQAGIGAVEGARSLPDLRRMAELTGARAPAGGLDCGDGVRLAAGEPLVCPTSSGFEAVVTDLVRTLADRQTARVVPVGSSPVLGAVDAAGLRDLDVTRRNDVPFRVRVSCVDVRPGTYEQAYDAVLRGTAVARAAVRVTCTAPPAAAAVAPPPPPAPAVQEPPAAQPPAQAPAAPAPAPPVVQPQVQPQPAAQAQAQAQVQPLTAAALQSQEELQLALALQADEELRGVEQLAAVDRRREQHSRAIVLLATAMAVASAAGLARLRTAPRTRVGRSS